MKRGEIYWARFDEPVGRRPALVLTRTPALGYLNSVTLVRITTRVRGTEAEVPLGAREGLTRPSVANAFNIDTLKAERLDRDPIGEIPAWRLDELDAALRYALDIRT